ncbi:hypothetical protein [Nocardioides sp.]|uniref:hypothetical protein n=1 Tax=Nocardioides sp. TaxID=35761 RepID=UPI0035197DEF
MPDPASRTRPARRGALLAALAIGLGLIAAPVAFAMFDRAPQGATMIADFEPFMTAPRLEGFQNDIATIDAAVREVDASTDPVVVEAREASAGYAPLSEQWPQIHEDMTGLLDDVQANLGNYQAVAALPDFALFPWFFLVPGALITALAGLGLLAPRRRTALVRGGLALLGAGLIAAPVAFQMFDRAPAGGRMMDAFATIQTTENVTRIQGYFATMAAGQGALRLDVVPAVAQRIGPDAAAETLPATTALDAAWIGILGDMTPMIGAMSDNVDSYQAVASLPPFPLFPWFFVAPGVLLLAIAGPGLRGRRPTEEAATRAPSPTPSPADAPAPGLTEGVR